jgi:hypothetical protein
MPRPATWLSRAPEIFEEVSRTPDGQSLDWRDVRALFGIQRRAASRIIARLQPEASTNGNRVDRAQLLAWLEPIKARAEDQRARAVQFAHKLREVEAEKQARRDAFRARFGMTPPTWTVTPELESTAVSSLPAGVLLGPGKMEITFASDNPIAACELLHALSKAMEHDWFRFCAVIAPKAVEAAKSSEESIATFLNELEQQRSEGSDLD